MNRIAIDLGFIEIYWYSIFILVAIISAFIVISIESKKQKLSENILIDLVFYTIIIGILGARLYYVLFNFNYYLTNPIEIFQIWNGGLAIHGGIISSLIFIIFYSKNKKINTKKLLDILVVGLILGQAIGRWGNFFNQEAYGMITTIDNLKDFHIPEFIINGMFISGDYRQPTFLYESLWCFLGFILMIIGRKYIKNLKVGQLTCFYLIWYGLERIIVEGFRTDSLMLGSIKVAQLISLLFIIIGITYLIKIYYNSKKDNNLYNKTNIILKNNKLIGG